MGLEAQHNSALELGKFSNTFSAPPPPNNRYRNEKLGLRIMTDIINRVNQDVLDASRQRFISRTAESNPVIRALAIMEWPIFNSTTSGMRPIASTLW